MTDFNTNTFERSIWKKIEQARGMNNSNDYYNTVLIILFLVSKRIINRSILNEIYYEEQLKETIYAVVKNSKSEALLKLLSDCIYKLSKHSFVNICEIVFEIDENMLKDNLSGLFDTILYEKARLEGKKGGDSMQPAELTKFMKAYVGSQKGMKVYNPFAGLASLVVSSESNNVYAQELHLETWAVGQLRLFANNNEFNFDHELFEEMDIKEKFQFVNFSNENQGVEFKNEDSILQWNTHEKFDLIVTSPPFGLRLTNYTQEETLGYRTLEPFLLDKGAQSLSEKGKLVMLSNHGILFRSSLPEKRLRENLVQNDLIDTIISFPSGMLFNTGIPTVMIVLNKSKTSKNKIRFVDAEPFVNKTSRLGYTINTDALLQEATSDVNSDAVRIVSKDEIIANDYNLNVPRYFCESIEVEDNIKLVKLGELISFKRGVATELSGHDKIVRIKDLKDTFLQYSLDLDTIAQSSSDRPVEKIDSSSLLLATRGNSLKPTYFEYDQTPIHLHRAMGILTFDVDQDKVDIAYLINELNSDYVKNQLDKYNVGAAIPHIRRRDLLDVVIKIPSFPQQKSLEVQRMEVASARDAYLKSFIVEKGLKEELESLKEQNTLEIASMKHTFRQYLGDLKSSTTGLKKYLTKRDGEQISINNVYSVNLNQTLLEHLKSMENTIVSLSKLLDKKDSMGVNVFHYNLKSLVDEAHQRFKKDNFNFELDLDENSFDDGEIEPIIEIDKEDFFKVFSNIVSNAINHGFESNKKTNIIRTAISYEIANGNCILEISNNGKPFPEGYSFKELTIRGDKTTDSKGKGIGGADIKDIMSYYKGTFDLVNDANTEFSVTYKLGFKLTQKEN